MVPDKCKECPCYDSVLAKCKYWEPGCFYENDEEDTDDSGDEAD